MTRHHRDQGRGDVTKQLSVVLRSSRLSRLGMLGGLTLGLAGEVVGSAARLGRTPDGVAVDLHRRTARQLREVLGEMKGLPMKLGQMISYVEDSIPPRYRAIYRETLADLRDRASPLSLEAMQEVIESDLGAPIDELFARFDPEPIAAASIGQVYRAVLHDGRTVAVKVQYPKIRRAIESDLKNVNLIFSSLSAAMPSVEMATMFESLAERLLDECDYVKEAESQVELGRFWAEDPEVLIPPVVEELTGPHVLVTGLVVGDDWAGLLSRASQPEKDRVGRIVFKFFYRSLYELGALHADPHPGNYVFIPEGPVAFLDFGCVQRYPSEVIEAFRALYADVLAGVRGDVLYQRICDAYGLPDEIPSDLQGLVEDYVLLSFEPVTAPQPFRFSKAYTEELMHAVMRLKLALSKKALVSRRRVYAERPGVIFLHRLAFGVSSLLATLGAEANWRDEMDVHTP